MDRSKFNDKGEWRKFARGLAVIALLAGAIASLHSRQLHLYPFIIALFFVLIAQIWPAAIRPLFVFFSYLGLIIGWVMTRVILTLAFYLILTPIGVVARLFSKKFLETGFKNDGISTYWIDREPVERESFERQY